MKTPKKVWDWRGYILHYAPDNSTYKHLLLTLSCYMDSAGGSCFPAVKTICKASSMSKPTVLKYLKKARQDGWIKISKIGLKGQKWKRQQYTASLPEKVVKEINHVPKGGKTDKAKVVKELNQYNTSPKNSTTLLFDEVSNDYNKDGAMDEKINWTVVRFHERIRERYGHHKSVKTATLDTWRDPIRLMLEQDDLGIEDVWKYMKFSLEDGFWKDTVKSTSGLRNNWEEIDAAINQKSGNKKKSESKMSYHNKL